VGLHKVSRRAKREKRGRERRKEKEKKRDGLKFENNTKIY